MGTSFFKLYPSFELKSSYNFPDKVKLKEFIITKPLLYKRLKGLI